MKKAVLRAIARVGEKAAKKAVNSASIVYCYQPKEPEAAKRKFMK